MKTPVKLGLGCLVAAGIGAAASLGVASMQSGAPAEARTAAVSALSGRVVPTGDPVLPGTRSAKPRPGSVVEVAGPFDDRFSVSHLDLRDGRVTGVLTVTSDVSELIDLQVLAGFYDARGTLLATSTYDKHGEGARPDEVVHFAVAAPDGVASRVASASVGVPVLVNE